MSRPPPPGRTAASDVLSELITQSVSQSVSHSLLLGQLRGWTLRSSDPSRRMGLLYRPRRAVNNSLPSSAEVKNGVILLRPYTSSWRGQGHYLLPLLIFKSSHSSVMWHYLSTVTMTNGLPLPRVNLRTRWISMDSCKHDLLFTAF